MMQWLFGKPKPIEEWHGVVVNDNPVNRAIVRLEDGQLVKMYVTDELWICLSVGDKVSGTKQGNKYTMSSSRE